MRIFDVALKDLLQVLRDWKSLLFLAVMPIAFTLFMGFAFGGLAREPDHRLAVGWVNEDRGGLVSEALHSILAGSETVRLVEVAAGSAEARVAKDDLAAAIIVPADYSRDVLKNKGVQLQIVANAGSTRGQSATQLLRRPVAQVHSAVEIAILSTDQLAIDGHIADGAAHRAELGAAFTEATASWDESQQAGLISVEKASRVEEPDLMNGNAYNQSSPGILVQFVIFGLVTSAEILVIERKSRTLQRMITTSMNRWQILAGHALAMFTLIAGQMLLLILFGHLALGVNYLGAPIGTLLVSIALALWVSALGLCIGVFAKSDEQAVLFSLIAMFLFTALGGAWFPLEGAGPAFRTLGHLTPAAWAMDGYQNILVRGLGAGSAVLPSAILLGYAVLFFVVAARKFARQSEA